MTPPLGPLGPGLGARRLPHEVCGPLHVRMGFCENIGLLGSRGVCVLFFGSEGGFGVFSPICDGWTNFRQSGVKLLVEK